MRDVCDLGQMLYYNWKWVWYVTAIMFLLNNTFIQVSALFPFVLIPINNSSRVSMSWLAPNISIP